MRPWHRDTVASATSSRSPSECLFIDGVLIERQVGSTYSPCSREPRLSNNTPTSPSEVSRASSQPQDLPSRLTTTTDVPHPPSPLLPLEYFAPSLEAGLHRPFQGQTKPSLRQASLASTGISSYALHTTRSLPIEVFHRPPPPPRCPTQYAPSFIARASPCRRRRAGGRIRSGRPDPAPGPVR